MRNKVGGFSSFLCLIVLVLFGAVATSSCSDSKVEKQRKESVDFRADQFDRAEAKLPLPRLENFPLRQALIEFSLREDLINHPWYTYILGINGNVVGYYVTKTPPVSTCAFLSSTEVINSSDSGKVVVTAPSLDGIYYGGAGASGTCGFFFFDYATNAMITLAPGVLFYSADQPLRLDAQPIKVATSP